MTSSFIKDYSLAIASPLSFYSSSTVLRVISNELAKEDKTDRFYALQWLWDYVAIHAKNEQIQLTADQYLILFPSGN
jgi:hypothetical protein